jgi:hypothetical protein
VGDFNIPLSQIGHQTKISKKTSALHDTTDQMDLTVIYGIFHSTATEYTFSSSTHGNFSRINHILRNKASLNKYKKTEIISYILSDQNGIKVELNNKSNYRKYPNTWRLKKDFTLK